jgi:diguanylate cyclase (GGDEF)-like protein
MPKSPDEVLEENERLTAELEEIKAELAEARRLLQIKAIELNAVLVQVDEISHVDTLTYLPNRRQIMKTLQNEVNRAERYNTILSIAMIDIDHFKQINDTHGHTAGDQVLLKLANLLQLNIRDTDTVGRYGGEEFLAVLPNTRLQHAGDLAERLCMRVREEEVDVGEKLKLTVSIGVAEYKVGKEDWNKFLGRSDKAMYKAKRLGRDRWEAAK